MRRRWLVGSSLVVLLATTQAHAVEPRDTTSDAQLAQARSEFSRGLSLEAAGNWAAALEAFEAVARVRTTPQVRFHVARCKEHLGRMTEALGDYRVAEYEAQSAALSELEDISEARQSLEGRIPRLIIELRGEASGARLRLDGTELGVNQLGKELAVDPGARHIEIQLRDGRRASRSVTATSGSVERVVIDAPPPVEAGLDATPPAPDAASQPQPAVESTSGFGPWPWVAAGVSVASLGVSAVLFVLREDASSRLERECVGRVCPEALSGVNADGQLYSTLAPVMLGIGIAGAGLSAVLFALDEPASEGASTAPRSGLVGVGGFATSDGVGLVASGRF